MKYKYIMINVPLYWLNEITLADGGPHSLVLPSVKYGLSVQKLNRMLGVELAYISDIDGMYLDYVGYR